MIKNDTCIENTNKLLEAYFKNRKSQINASEFEWTKSLVQCGVLVELKKKTSTSEEISSIQKSIENYELERQKIREMFPKRFFDNIEVG